MPKLFVLMKLFGVLLKRFALSDCEAKIILNVLKRSIYSDVICSAMLMREYLRVKMIHCHDNVHLLTFSNEKKKMKIRAGDECD